MVSTLPSCNIVLYGLAAEKKSTELGCCLTVGLIQEMGIYTEGGGCICTVEHGGRPTARNSDTQVYEAIRAALAEARTKVVVAVNSAMVGVYWEIGRQITEAVGERAEYGRSLLAYLSERPAEEFGKGFTVAT